MLCAEKHFTAAIDGYTRAVDLNPANAIYYSNRAFAHIKLENYGSAIADATKALEIDPKFVKARAERGRGAGEQIVHLAPVVS